MVLALAKQSGQHTAGRVKVLTLCRKKRGYTVCSSGYAATDVVH
jgi:hypothetical protein